MKIRNSIRWALVTCALGVTEWIIGRYIPDTGAAFFFLGLYFV